MLGFYAIAALPLAGLAFDANVALSSQNLTLTENSVTISTGVNTTVTAQTPLVLSQNSLAVSTGVTQTLTQQSLTATQNSLTLSTGVNTTLNSQSLTLSENSVSLSVDQVLSVTAQTPLALAINDLLVVVQPPTFDSLPLALTQNSLTLSTTVNALLGQQVLALTQNSVALSTDQNLSITGQSLSLTQNSVTLSTEQTISLTRQTPLHTTLNFLSVSNSTTLTLVGQSLQLTQNGFRLWKGIDTLQKASCNGWVPGHWENIGYGGLVYGDDFAIATQPLCGTPHPLPPINKQPKQTWGTINQTPTVPTTWKDIPT
jgi:hypothetical protein